MFFKPWWSPMLHLYGVSSERACSRGQGTHTRGEQHLSLFSCLFCPTSASCWGEVKGLGRNWVFRSSPDPQSGMNLKRRGTLVCLLRTTSSHSQVSPGMETPHHLWATWFIFGYPPYIRKASSCILVEYPIFQSVPASKASPWPWRPIGLQMGAETS